MGRRPKISREDVLQAAQGVFAERGFEATTLAAIAAKLGVSPAALLRHAPNKETLFTAAMAYRAPGDVSLPIEFVGDLDGTEEPRLVLRRLSKVLIPLLEAKLDEQVVRWMRAKSVEEASGSPLPFNPDLCPTLQRHALVLIEGYLSRASAAGQLRAGDPLAAALMLLGSCQAYVFLHRIGRVLDPPLPLERYLDTLVDIWTCGVLPPG